MSSGNGRLLPENLTTDSLNSLMFSLDLIGTRFKGLDFNYDCRCVSYQEKAEQYPRRFPLQSLHQRLNNIEINFKPF